MIDLQLLDQRVDVLDEGCLPHLAGGSTNTAGNTWPDVGLSNPGRIPESLRSSVHAPPYTCLGIGKKGINTSNKS